MSQNRPLAQLNGSLEESQQNQQNQQKAPSFECCVCYNEGTKIPEDQPATVTGRIQPACKHDICGTCYTRIIMEKGKESLCPICRGRYWTLQQEQQTLQESNMFQESQSLIDVLRMLQIQPPRVYTLANSRNIVFDF